MQHKDIWVSLFKQDQSLWIELDLRLRHFEKLLKRIPLPENQKLKLVQESVKEKSGYFACLVNKNIDVLLLHEFFETKKSRNILLNRETDRYMQVFNAYSFSGKTNLSAAYQYLDLPEEPVKAGSGLDLFSGVAVAKNETGLNESLSKLLNDIEQFNTLQDTPFIYKAQLAFWEMIQAAGGFDNTREPLHYLNYSFDIENLKCYKLLNMEKGLCDIRTRINTGKSDPLAWSVFIYDILQKELDEKNALLKALYRQEIQFDHLKASQKIASNYLFETGFDTPLHNVKATDTEQKILRAALKSGTLHASDINKLLALGKQSGDAQNFLRSGYFVQDTTETGESIWIISASHFNPHRLSIYNNIPAAQKAVRPVITEPAVQIQAEPVSAINEMVEEPKTIAAPIRKAFFG